jgi:hypothetical protein
MTPTANAQLASIVNDFGTHWKLIDISIGVLTKPDRIPSGEEDRWLRFIRGEYETLQNGWFCVKQPNSKMLSQGITWTEARTQENDYFSMTAPWSSLESTYQNYLRTSNLTERLSIILSELISKRSWTTSFLWRLRLILDVVGCQRFTRSFRTLSGRLNKIS